MKLILNRFLRSIPTCVGIPVEMTVVYCHPIDRRGVRRFIPNSYCFFFFGDETLQVHLLWAAIGRIAF